MGNVVPINDSDDLYTLEVSAEYDPHEIVTRSTDKEHGHHQSFNISVEPNQGGLIAEIVQSGRHPQYKTMGHFIRDAIWHRLHFVKENMRDTEGLEILQRERMKARRERRSNEIKDWEQGFENYLNLLSSYSRHKDWDGLARVINDMMEDAEHTREPYASRLHEFANRYRSELPDGY